MLKTLAKSSSQTIPKCKEEADISVGDNSFISILTKCHNSSAFSKLLHSKNNDGRVYTEDALSVWTTAGQTFVIRLVQCVSSIKTGTRRIIRLDELPFEVLRRINKDSSSRRTMRLAPVFLLETHNQTTNVGPSSSRRIMRPLVWKRPVSNISNRDDKHFTKQNTGCVVVFRSYCFYPKYKESLLRQSAIPTFYNLLPLLVLWFTILFNNYSWIKHDY